MTEYGGAESILSTTQRFFIVVAFIEIPFPSPLADIGRVLDELLIKKH